MGLVPDEQLSKWEKAASRLLAQLKEREARIAELEEGLRACIEWAASDSEHEACKGVIATASRLVQLRD